MADNGVSDQFPDRPGTSKAQEALNDGAKDFWEYVEKNRNNWTQMKSKIEPLKLTRRESELEKMRQAAELERQRQLAELEKQREAEEFTRKAIEKEKQREAFEAVDQLRACQESHREAAEEKKRQEAEEKKRQDLEQERQRQATEAQRVAYEEISDKLRDCQEKQRLDVELESQREAAEAEKLRETKSELVKAVGKVLSDVAQEFKDKMKSKNPPYIYFLALNLRLDDEQPICLVCKTPAGLVTYFFPQKAKNLAKCPLRRSRVRVCVPQKVPVVRL